MSTYMNVSVVSVRVGSVVLDEGHVQELGRHVGSSERREGDIHAMVSALVYLDLDVSSDCWEVPL